MSYEEDNESGSDRDFGDLFGSEDEASDIDDGRSQSDSPAPAPSTTAAKAPVTNSNNLDNLFGSHSEESDQESEPEKRQTLKQRSARIESSEDEGTKSQEEDEENREEYDEYDTQSSRKQRVEVSLEMPQLKVPYSDTNKYYLAKLPRFLDIEVNPFEANDFEIQIEEGLTPAQQQEAIREQIETTIRWRRVGKKMESNAHIVEWEDGKKSLMLGDECFDIVTKPVGGDDHSYLLAHQTGSGALESQTEFTDHMRFMPSGLKSDTHRHLTAQIADKQVRKNRTKMFFTDKDPELMKQELESQENERLRAQKKLELQRKKVDMRYGESTSRRNNDFGDYDTMDYDRPSQSLQQDRYDEDFVVDDDDYDEEEERSRENRLAQVKKAGMDKYKKRSRYSDEEEEEEESEGENDIMEDDDDEEEVVVRRNKRNRVYSDDDE